MLLDDVKAIVAALPAQLNEKYGVFSFELPLAERKAFLSTKKLVYRASFRLDDNARALRFTEMLKETGSGMASSDGVSPGFGFKTETYNTFSGARKGTIAEQSELFGKLYKYTFDYSEARKQFEQAAVKAGYSFDYQATRIGL
jgi:hypothetical protein